MHKGEPRVGIVMLLYNRADVATACLGSLAAAKTGVSWELYLLDNASREAESELVRSEFGRLAADGTIAGRFVRSEVNHGFPKGNNLGIRFFLERDDITHICLLNSDVVVTDYWLDRLLEKDADAIGPVTNACGNEQTLPAPRSLLTTEDVFPEVNRWAQERFRTFQGYCRETDFLGFFCFIARTELFLAVGLLDERFGQGAYEDDDFCLRIRAAGFTMVIARDVFIYHWGTASFYEIPALEFYRILAVNRKKFEAKYQKPWSDRSLLPVRGVLDDLEFLAGTPVAGSYELARHAADQSMEYLGRVMQQKGAPQGVKRAVAHLCKNMFARLPWVKSQQFATLREFFEATSTAEPVIVLGRFFPAEADLKDGYFQRVRLVDETLAGHCRIYLRYEDAESRSGIFLPAVVRKMPNVYEVVVRRRNFVHLVGALLLGLVCGRIYVHSVLRFDDLISRALYLLARKRVFDVHGVVPEEFVFEGDEINSKRFGHLERWAVERASRLVVVTHAMADHLREKYGLAPDYGYSCMSMLPRLGRWSADDATTTGRDGVIYCGGLHKWQQVGKMLDYVHRNAGRQRFTFLVTDPEAISRAYRERYGTPFPGVITSALPEEVAGWYRSHAYGLVLREDIIVNRVACPTKLVEYLQYGLVPIVDSVALGDFDRHGYKYVCEMSPLPDEKTRVDMARHNLTVLKRLYYQFLVDSEGLKSLLAANASH